MKIFITTYQKRFSYAQKIKGMLKNSPYEFFFVYGRGNLNKVEPFIELDCPEGYENLPEKTFSLVEHFMANHPDERMVKMDDNTFLDVEKLKAYESATEDYIGHFYTYQSGGEYDKIFHWYKIQNESYRVPKKTFPLRYAEGAMYMLSRKACQKIVSAGRTFFQSVPETYLGEDTKVGMCLEGEDIVKRDIKFKQDLDYEITQDFLSIHPVSLLVFERLEEATTNDKKAEVLKNFNYLNENVLRTTYLKKYKS